MYSTWSKHYTVVVEWTFARPFRSSRELGSIANNAKLHD